MFIRTLPQAIWDISMISVAGLSVWRGGWAERTIAFTTIVGSIATAVFQNTRDESATQWADMAVDCTCLVIFVGVALRSRRLWPLFVAAFQLIAVVIYAARLADIRVGARSPFTAGVIWSYLILVAVVVGVFLNTRDRRGPSPTIRSSST